MPTSQHVFTYEFLTGDQSKLIDQAAQCLTRSFIGVEIEGKWVQEPMCGVLNINDDDFYQFTKDYLESTVDQGFCMIARDQEDQVVGVLAGDTNAPEIIGEDVFKGSFADMNVILHVLEDVDKRFMEDYKKQKGKEIEDGELVHLFMLGVTAKEGRHDIIKQLGKGLIEKASTNGMKALYGEATNIRSIRVMEKYHGFKKYKDINGSHIVYKYRDNSRLNQISPDHGDGTYLLIKEL
ncbi:hypothetical protein EDD68_12127 [Melghiribacillus thermohalophilus]|uniref:N-acetyltransferase domain-containing protein n=1 Tax=Melghiribacillus thermohalophilus TaxID=1324956 RepID=A0A4R3MVM7_9BACI|nr:hypothetical protein [Melghiribacillus thermohalophilus]TCT18773.1 hypothetical protein EDD68_12127 [Melghiribacillus thermohalophilus]